MPYYVYVSARDEGETWQEFPLPAGLRNVYTVACALRVVLTWRAVCSPMVRRLRRGCEGFCSRVG